MYFATPPALHVRSSSNFVSRSILLLRGWQNIYGDVFADDSLTEVSCPRQHHCIVKRTNWVEPDASDVVIFYDHDLMSTPPHKIPGQLWVYHAGEAQMTLDVDHMENWDGYFNYTHDFRQDSFMRMYAKGYKKLGIPYTRNFTAEKLKKLITNMLPENALWFVSNCHTVPWRFRVTSARFEYAHDLYSSGALNRSAYTKTDNCRKHSLLKQILKENIDDWTLQWSIILIIFPLKTLSVKTISLKSCGKY